MQSVRVRGVVLGVMVALAFVVAVPTSVATAGPVRLAFEAGNQVYIRDGDTVTPITDFTYANLRALAWSPDAMRMAAIVDSAGTDQPAQIVVFSAGGDAPVRQAQTVVTGAGSEFASVRWSPDSTKLVFEDQVNNERHIDLVNADGSDLQTLPGITDANTPVFTPAEDRLLFVGGAKLDQLATVRLDGSDRQAVLPDAGLPNSMFDPAYSPDGKRLVVYAFFGVQGSDLFVAPLDGSSKARALGLRGSEGECSGPGSAVWLADSAHVVADFGHCSVNPPKPDRLVQIGVDDASLVDVRVGTDTTPGFPQVQGDGLVEPIPKAAPPTVLRTATTTALPPTTTSTAASTASEPTTTTSTTSHSTMQVAQRPSAGGGLGRGVLGSIGAVALLGSAAAVWRHRRATPFG